MILWIAASADFHGFEAEGADFIEHFIKGQMLVDRVKDPDGDFLFCSGRKSGAKLAVSGPSSHGTIGYCAQRSSGRKSHGSGHAGGSFGQELTAIYRVLARTGTHSGFPSTEKVNATGEGIIRLWRLGASAEMPVVNPFTSEAGAMRDVICCGRMRLPRGFTLRVPCRLERHRLAPVNAL